MFTGMLTPFIYNKYIVHRESILVIVIAQLLVIIASAMCVV